MLALFRRRLKTLNRAEILAANIEHNFYTFKKLLPRQQVMPVLKSNAYGHGIAEIVTILKKMNCPYLVTDSYFEALQIFEVSKKQKVLVVGWNHPENFRHFDFDRIALTIYDLPSLEALITLKKKVLVHLKINTGLNRQGLLPEELGIYLEKIKAAPHIILDGVFSHFSSADDPDNTVTKEQEKLFSKCLDEVEKSGFKPKFIHLANTAGALKTIDKRINSFRLGIGLYGHNPLSPKDALFAKLEELKPALRIVSTLVNVLSLKKGDKVGYNGTFIAQRKMRLGVVPVGYYECMPRRLSNTGFFRTGTHPLPIRGRIHMNLTCFDLKDSELAIGDEVEVISAEKDGLNSVARIAVAAGTIPYEILVHINESIRRVII